MDIIHVKGNGPLHGEVKIQGSKNAVLPMLAATILIKGACRLKNCPRISDVECMRRLLLSMGCYAEWEEADLIVDATALKENRLPRELVTSMRSSVFLLGPLLARCREVMIDYPGGCVIGERPIDIHLELLKNLGADFIIEDSYITATAKQWNGACVRLPFPSVGATENGVLAAVLASGKTIITGCAKEPEIQYLCHFLNAAGAKIAGIGTDTLFIEGVESLHSVTYEVPADRIVAGTYLFSAVASQGHVYLKSAPVEELSAALEVVKQMGACIFIDESGLGIWQKERPKALSLVRTSVYPGFPTDLQSVLLTALAVSRGESIVEENIFSNRFKIVKELNRMGADITIRDNRAHIIGKNTLTGGTLLAEDLRGGAALVVAAICARGNSLIGNCHYINRGYEDICRDFRRMGASIEKIGRI